MLGYCCDQETTLARKVKLRGIRDYDPGSGGPDSAAYLAYREETTFRRAVICPACYAQLDNSCGIAQIGGRTFGLAGTSRGDKAAVVDETKYRAFQRRQARKLGLDLGEED